MRFYNKITKPITSVYIHMEDFYKFSILKMSGEVVTELQDMQQENHCFSA